MQRRLALKLGAGDEFPAGLRLKAAVVHAHVFDLINGAGVGAGDRVGVAEELVHFGEVEGPAAAPSEHHRLVAGLIHDPVPVETAGLRVSVLPGGCSGFKYSLNIEERALEDDVVMEINRTRIFMDGFSMQYLNGITVDYTSSMQGSGFTFNNPNATGGCGCGSSFTA